MTPEQRACFGFSRRPFTVHSTDTPWLDQDRQKALERLRQLVGRGGFALVHGPPGCGKTRLLRHLIDQCNTNTHQGVYIPHATLNESGMLQNLAWKLGVEPANSRPRNIQRIANHLATGKTPLLVFDELQHAAVSTLESMRLLCEEELPGHRRIPIIMAGTDDFVALLSMKVCESLRQRLTLCIHLKPLAPEQVHDYLKHHFRNAQVEHPIIDPAAVNLIAETTGGIPRLIEHLTLAALEIAADQQHQSVNLEHVHQAAELTFIPNRERHCP